MNTLAISRLAWIGAPPARVAALPWQVDIHPDSDGFLLADEPFGYDAYVVTLCQFGIPALELLAALRKRTTAPLIALDDSGLPALVAALGAGADAVLPLSAGEAGVVAAMTALARRAGASLAAACWSVGTREASLRSPGGVVLPLSAAEHTIMLALAEAHGAPVARRELATQIWGDSDGAMDNPLHAAIYRLRRRIADACGDMPPIRSVPRAGYAFAAPIRLED